MEKLCYIEDYIGGVICYEKHKQYFLLDNSSKVCFEGDKKELEEYLGHKITDDNISYAKCK